MVKEQQELAILVRARDLASKTIGRVNRGLSNLGRTARQGVATAARNLARLGTIAAGVGVGLAAVGIKLAAGFEDQMNRSLAIVSGVTPKIRKEMESTARDVARTTTFSAAEAAEAYFFLASAGLDAEQQIAAMPAVAKFAQAGMFDLATATDLVTDAQSALGLKSKDAQKNLKNLIGLSDQLVQANNLSNATVEQFSAALTTKAGAAMRKYGIDAAEGLGVLAVFADAGVKGEKAGTTFASMLTGLTNAAVKNEKAFKKYNLQIFDANGELRPMTDITRDLTRVMGDMTDEQRAAAYQQLGINRLTANGVDLLLGQGKAQEQYERKLRKAGGTTEKVAEKQVQGFSAQLSILRSNLEDIGIVVGSAFLPGLTKITKKVSTFLSSKDGQQAVQRFARQVGSSFEKAVAAGEKFLTGLDWEAIKKNLGGLLSGFAELGLAVGPTALEALKAMPWETISEAAQFLAQGAKKMLEMFTGAPEWLKTAIVTGWGLNKLTGGAVGSMVSELGKGLIRGVLNLTAGVVNVTGGRVTGGGTGGAAAGKGGSSKLLPLAGLATLPFIMGGDSSGSELAGPVGSMAIQDRLDGIDKRLLELKSQDSQNARDSEFLLQLSRQALVAGNVDVANKIVDGTYALGDLKDGLVPEVQALGTKTGAVAGAVSRTTTAVNAATSAIRAQDLSLTVQVTSQTSISARDVANKQVKTYLRAVPI